MPNFGLLWEQQLASDPPATLVNMAAWNRWTVAVAHEGRGRLHIAWLVGAASS